MYLHDLIMEDLVTLQFEFTVPSQIILIFSFHHRDISSLLSLLVRAGLQTGLQAAGELRAASFISTNLGCLPQAGLEGFVQSFVGHQIKENTEDNEH